MRATMHAYDVCRERHLYSTTSRCTHARLDSCIETNISNSCVIIRYIYNSFFTFTSSFIHMHAEIHTFTYTQHTNTPAECTHIYAASPIKRIIRAGDVYYVVLLYCIPLMRLTTLWNRYSFDNRSVFMPLTPVNTN